MGVGVEVVGDAGVVVGYWAQVRAVSQAVLVGQGGDVFGARLNPHLFNVAYRCGSGARTTPSPALALAGPSSRSISRLNRAALLCDRPLPVCNLGGSVSEFSGLSASSPKQPHGAARVPGQRRQKKGRETGGLVESRRSRWRRELEESAGVCLRAIMQTIWERHCRGGWAAC